MTGDIKKESGWQDQLTDERASLADNSHAEHNADARSVEMEVDPPASSLRSGRAASSCTRTTASLVPRPARVDRTVCRYSLVLKKAKLKKIWFSFMVVCNFDMLNSVLVFLYCVYCIALRIETSLYSAC